MTCSTRVICRRVPVREHVQQPSLGPGKRPPGAIQNCVIIQAVAAAALADHLDQPGEPGSGAHVRALTRTGVWLHLHATVLDGPRPRSAAVVIEPARPHHLAPILTRAHGLTQREREIASLIIDGHSTAEIAEQLFLSPHTIKDHLKAIFDKVGVRSRRGLAASLSAGRLP